MTRKACGLQIIIVWKRRQEDRMPRSGASGLQYHDVPKLLTIALPRMFPAPGQRGLSHRLQ